MGNLEIWNLAKSVNYCTVKKWSFPLRTSSVNVSKSAGSCRFGHSFIFFEVLNAYFNDETSWCQAEIASNELQTSNVYQTQEAENSDPRSEEEQII